MIGYQAYDCNAMAAIILQYMYVCTCMSKDTRDELVGRDGQMVKFESNKVNNWPAASSFLKHNMQDHKSARAAHFLLY